MTKQELRELANKIAREIEPEKYAFDHDNERSAFRVGADYGIECALEAAFKLLEKDKAA